MRSRDFVAKGVARRQLSRMVAAGKLQRVARGLYALPAYQGGEQSGLVAVAKRLQAFCVQDNPVAQVAGDELVLLLGTGLATAGSTAAALREALGQPWGSPSRPKR